VIVLVVSVLLVPPAAVEIAQTIEERR
jgi:hypothetical protein